MPVGQNWLPDFAGIVRWGSDIDLVYSMAEILAR
jgi:hypothetical protein